MITIKDLKFIVIGKVGDEVEVSQEKGNLWVLNEGNFEFDTEKPIRIFVKGKEIKDVDN